MGFDQKVELIGCDVLKNEPMSKHTSFKIGGPVDYFVKVKTKDELSLILNLIRDLTHSPLEIVEHHIL